MAESLADIYLGEKKEEPASSLTDIYLSGSNNKVESNLVPAGAPVNGQTEYVTPEELAKQVKESENISPRRYKYISRLPVDLASAASELPGDVGSAIYEHAAAGGSQISKGMGQLTTNEPASGVGNIGMGLMGVVASPFTGANQELIQKPITKLTGSHEIGERASLVAPILPLGKLASSVVASKVPSNKAMNILVDTIGPENISTVVNELKSNPRLSVYDVSPGVQQMAQKLILTEGSHQNKFAKAVEERTATAKGAVNETVDSTLGVPVNALEKINEMKAAAVKTGKDLIEPHVEKAGTADITKVVNSIDDLIASGGPVERRTLKALKAGEEPPLPLSDAQNKLFQIREKLRGDWADKDQMFLDVKGEQGLHARQKELRADAQSLLDSSVGSERSLGKKLMDIRNQMVDAIDANAPGYKDALHKYRDDMQVQEAFDRGFNILNPNPKKIESRPEFLQDWWTNATKGEKEAMREGARIAFDSTIRGYKAAARKGTDIVQNEFNVENLKTMFGEKETAKMVKELNDERRIADSNVKLLGNSQTAMRLKVNSNIDLPVEKSLNPLGYAIGAIGEVASTAAGYPGIGAAIMAGNAARDITHLGKVKLARMKNEHLTDLLTATGEARQNLIDALQARIPQAKQSLLQRTRNLALPVLPP